MNPICCVHIPELKFLSFINLANFIEFEEPMWSISPDLLSTLYKLLSYLNATDITIVSSILKLKKRIISTLFNIWCDYLFDDIWIKLTYFHYNKKNILYNISHTRKYMMYHCLRPDFSIPAFLLLHRVTLVTSLLLWHSSRYNDSIEKTRSK